MPPRRSVLIWLQGTPSRKGLIDVKEYKEYEVTDERSDTHMPVASRDPSDAWMQKFFEGLDRELRRKDDRSEEDKKGKQQTDEQEHNE